VLDPESGIATFIIFRNVRVDGPIIDRGSRPNNFGISFGTGRANLASGGVFRREFFGMLTIDKNRLFVSKEGVGTQTGGVVAFGGIGAESSTVEVNPAVEFDQDVFGGTIRPGEDGEGLAGLNHGNGRLVSVRNRSRVGGVTLVRKTFWIKGRVAVAAILAGYGDPRNFRSILIKRDGCAGP
jgi:hypothetical protein